MESLSRPSLNINEFSKYFAPIRESVWLLPKIIIRETLTAPYSHRESITRENGVVINENQEGSGELTCRNNETYKGCSVAYHFKRRY